MDYKCGDTVGYKFNNEEHVGIITFIDWDDYLIDDKINIKEKDILGIVEPVTFDIKDMINSDDAGKGIWFPMGEENSGVAFFEPKQTEEQNTELLDKAYADGYNKAIDDVLKMINAEGWLVFDSHKEELERMKKGLRENVVCDIR